MFHVSVIIDGLQGIFFKVCDIQIKEIGMSYHLSQTPPNIKTDKGFETLFQSE